MMQKSYDNGSPAIDLDENGVGFAYYGNNAVAMCINPGSASHHFSYYVFDKNRAKTMLLGIDEYGVGFCSSSKRKSADMVDDIVFCLTENKGFYARNSKVEKEWLWDKTSLSDFIVVPLNESFTVHIKDKNTIKLEFNSENVSHTFDIGVKKIRNDTYLDHSRRLPDGKMNVTIPQVSLKQRQESFNKSMREKRNLIHPKSQNLSDMVKDIVAKLEDRFDDYDRRTLSMTSSIGREVQGLAMTTTLNEIPHIKLVGTETGVFTGFGNSIYLDSNQELQDSIPEKLRTLKGTWKGEVEVRSTLREMNPPLPRSYILRANSGRYSDMLVVDSKNISADNPTGMITPQGLPVPWIRWKNFQQEVFDVKEVSRGPLLVALIFRQGDAQAVGSEYALEIFHKNLQQSNSLSTLKSRLRLYKINVGDDSSILQDLDIRQLPTFVVYYQGGLVYAGAMGGKKMKTSSTGSKPQILIIEPNVKLQIGCEKTLRKFGCDTYLCLSVAEAIERVQQFRNLLGDGPSMVFDVVLISNDVASSDLSVLSQRLSEFIKKKRTVIAGLVSVLGENGKRNLSGIKWNNFAFTGKSSLVHPVLSDISQILIQNPIKPSGIQQALDLRENFSDDSYLGLTPEFLEVKLNKIIDQVDNQVDSLSLRRQSSVGIRLSAEDITLQGKNMTK